LLAAIVTIAIVDPTVDYAYSDIHPRVQNEITPH